MARRFTHGGRLDTRDRGPFVTCDLHTRTVLDAIAASKAARLSSGFLDAITGSEYAHDWLSQTASDIYRIRKDHAEAECYDAGFDGGEFSGPAHAEQEAVETDRAEAHFFNYTGTTFSHAVRCRISEKTAHRLGF